MDKNLKITCFGEVLWDVFPSGEKIGGAPLNVAIRLQSLGAAASMISCVAADKRGDKIINHLNTLGVNTSCIEVQEEYPTGIVQVTLDESGSATYDITYPVAWGELLIYAAAIDGLRVSTDVLP